MSDTPRILARLAQALGLDEEAFTKPDDMSSEQITKLQDTAELLDAWARIEDRQARRRCLSYVKSAAERSETR